MKSDDWGKLEKWAEGEMFKMGKQYIDDIDETFQLGDIHGTRLDFRTYSNRWNGWKFYHECGPQGGHYDIREDGVCYKCRKQLPTYKALVFSAKMSKFGK